MPAPIQRYSDPRLVGGSLVKPFDQSYQWIRISFHPLHPKSNFIKEIAIRSFKVLTGALAIALTAPLALVGRAIQMAHYHAMTNESRRSPSPVSVHGLTLPDLESAELPKGQVYHGTSVDSAIQILRWGFDPSKSQGNSKLGRATYVSVANTVSSSYGQNQLILSLNLRHGEVAYLPNRRYDECKNNVLSALPIGKFDDAYRMKAIHDLFIQNGYRAIKYDLDFYGTDEAWAVYHTGSISIKKVQSAPEASPVAPLLV